MVKIVYEVRIKRAWNDNAHKIAGFFPTSEMASQHIDSWPQFIRDNLSHISVEVADDFTIVPPEHMQTGVAKIFHAWPDVEIDQLERLRKIRDDHRIVSIGGKVESACRELAQALKAMDRQLDWVNFDHPEPDRRESLSNAVGPHVRIREKDIQETWANLKAAWETYDKERVRL